MTDHDYSSFLPEITEKEFLYYRNQQRIADKIFRNRPGQDRKLFNKNDHHFIDNPMDEYPTKNYNGEHDKEHKKIIADVLDNSGSVYNQVYRKKNKRYRQIHLEYPVYGMLEAKNYKMFYNSAHSVTIYLTEDFITQLQSIIKPYLEMDNGTLDKNYNKLITRLGNIIASHVPYLDKCKRTVSKQIGRTIFANYWHNPLRKYNYPITVTYASYHNEIGVVACGISDIIELK
jgi:hypothetical protein